MSSRYKPLYTSVSNYYNHALYLWPDLLQGWELPKLSLTLRGPNAGFVRYTENRILAHPELFDRYSEQYAKETIGHEMAHLVAYQIFGTEIFSRHHGIEWQSIMRAFDLEPEVYHTYDVVGLKKSYKKARFHYSCDCGNQYLMTPYAHCTLQKKPDVVSCKECFSILSFTGLKSVVA